MKWTMWIAVLGIAGAMTGHAGEVHPACSGAEFRAFDFMHGVWRVTDQENRLWGYAQLEPAAGGCATLEHWYGARGGRGNGLVFYDATQKQWQRVYVTAGFQELDFPGATVEGGIRFMGKFVEKGVETRVRVTYRKTPDGSVEITDESTTDGVNWKLESTKPHARAEKLPTPPAGPAIHPECKAEAFRDFGRWASAWSSGLTADVVEQVKVETKARGCLLMDVIRDAAGAEYLGFSFYDPAKQSWHRRAAGAGKVFRYDDPAKK
ncbi:MAG: hypothetical protein JNL98_31890 [Bryobacterales bacterium]|nr:hypothetical protein [Bryobacterales bacterium]